MSKILYVSICDSENELLQSCIGLKQPENRPAELVYAKPGRITGDDSQENIAERIENVRLIKAAKAALENWLQVNVKGNLSEEAPRYQ